jgi:hypothetical protein
MNELAPAVMRNGSDPLFPLHLFNYMGGIVFLFLSLLGGRFCAWVDVTCVQGGSLFPSSQGWVLSVLKRGCGCCLLFARIFILYVLSCPRRN